VYIIHGHKKLNTSKKIFVLQIYGMTDKINRLTAISDIPPFEQSCVPNCYWYIDRNSRVVIKAAKSINRGEHLTICYTDVLADTPKRQTKLLLDLFMTCKCERCLDPTELGSNFNSVVCHKK